MNIPPNTRKFSLSLAQQNHPLVTRAGEEAKFIAYVPDNREYYQVVCSHNGENLSCGANGRFYSDDNDSPNDLFLAPVGYCQGLPVWLGDKLMWEGDGSPTEIKASVEDNQSFFDYCEWPSKAPIVETRMSETEAYSCFVDIGLSSGAKGVLAVANKAIERAILDGDVVPTSVVKDMLLSAHGDRHLGTCEHMAQIAIDKYLESLK